MPDHRLAFRDLPDNLLERLQPALAAQGDPPVLVVAAEDGLEFTGGGSPEFMLGARAAEALGDVWPAWKNQLAE